MLIFLVYYNQERIRSIQVSNSQFNIKSKQSHQMQTSITNISI